MLTGYGDTLSARPGADVTVYVSTDAPAFSAELVRLLGRAPRPDAPREVPIERVAGTRVEGRGQVQETHRGSFGWAPDAGPLPPAVTFAAWVWLMAPTPGRVQGILSGEGIALALDEQTRPCVIVGDERVTAEQPLLARTWYLLAGGVDRLTGEARLHMLAPTGAAASPSIAAAVRAGRAPLPAEAPIASASGGAPLLLAALPATGGAEIPRVECLLNGKLEQPVVFDGLLDGDGARRVAAGGPADAGLAVRHHWDLGEDTDASVMSDLGEGGAELTLVNAPTLAMTGHRFSGCHLRASAAPREYGAAHFHDDDLDDARWAPSATLGVPATLASGLYAIRLETDGGEVDHVPLCVPPGPAPARARVAFLLPTLTHLAYANARATGMGLPPASRDRLTLRLLDDHPEWGASAYDLHSDGSGVSISSALRPIMGLRPNHWSRGRDEPLLLAADLEVVAWLEHTGTAYDVLTDHDLHAGGAAALTGYDVLVTGPHPEYCTEAMLDAIESFKRDGGSLMYLGGNGFYWVTTVSPRRPHLIETRRSHSGGRAWTGEPGEDELATTGEPGGLWRHRGRAPQRLVGVGFTAMGSAERWPGYRRLPAADDPRAAFAFEGVAGADDGTFLAGAAGNEIDRVDAALGTPAHALRLATSEGLHDERFSTGPEDVPMLLPGVGLGGTDPRVRADLVFYETGAGGAVFSVGSIAWCLALGADGYANDVARVTTNTLRRMLADEPFELPNTSRER